MDQDKIWDHFQNSPDAEGKTFQSDSRYRFLADQVQPGKRVLNIGVGRGGLESLLLGKGAKVFSLDPSEDSIRHLRARLNMGEQARAGYSQAIPFGDRSFDLVIMSEVLEHLSQEVLLQTVAECHRVLDQGGTFMGTVPADEDLAENEVVCPDCGKVFHRWGHVQSFDRARLTNTLATHFSALQVQRRYFGNWRTLNWKGKTSHVLKVLLMGLGIHGSAENFYFTGRKT